MIQVAHRDILEESEPMELEDEVHNETRWWAMRGT